MATILARNDGVLLWVVADSSYSELPAGAAASLNFDVHTNAALYADLQANTEHYTLSGSVLLKDAVPVDVVDLCRDCADYQSVPTLRTKLEDGQDLAAAELRCVLRYALRRLDPSS